MTLSRRAPIASIVRSDAGMIQTPAGTLAERYKYGTRLRKKVPREKHADLHGPAHRDAVAILAATDRTRVPELIPVRYERMLANPFAFLRGAAAVMAEDLRHQPTARIPVQACGDCHLMNFGAFATPEQNVLFDINDFDETLPGWISPRTSSGWRQALRLPHWRRVSRRSGRGQSRPRRSMLTEAVCEPWRNCHRWRAGTAGSISRGRSSASNIAPSGVSCKESS